MRLDNRNEGRSFFHLDILRSTVSLTDAAGGSRQSIFYDAWGNERDRMGASANNFTFTGHELDEETGLIYAKARFYDADIGRFLSQDTVPGDVGDAPSLNRYVYVRGNPTSFVDPTGRTGEPVTTTTTLTYVLELEYIAAGGGGAAAGAFSVPGVGVIVAAIGGVKAAVDVREAETRLQLEVEIAQHFNDQARRRLRHQLQQQGLVILEDEDPFQRLAEERLRQELEKLGFDIGIGRIRDSEERDSQNGKVVNEGRDGRSRKNDAKESSKPKNVIETGKPSAGVMNNIKGRVFENVLENAARRKWKMPFFRATRTGIDIGLLEDGSVVLTEAKFAKRL